MPRSSPIAPENKEIALYVIMFFQIFLQMSIILCSFAAESPEVPEEIHTSGLSFV